ncbi:Zn(II)2Cys6 transcription factor domain-containing protein [Aspergillus stella-maris]|uniref:Zn(II)2Cys6 transcription factor domain-containing protein n=1 Tax=Aspergillus stella-maris TaxID=1810926 RepID=UPI003CCD5A0A
MASTLPSSKKPRKFHRKSRYGCLQCKQRRTKCDETRPTCNNCALRSLDCSLQKFESATGRQVATRTNRSAFTLPSLQWSIPTSQPSFCRSNTRDLEVYAHFQTNTAGSLYHNAVFKDIYRLEFPRMAQSFPFVGRGLLSIAYVHLASLSRESTPLLAEAAFHVNQALPQYLETLKVMTQENSAALFAFATLVVLFTLANANEECGALLQTAKNPLKKGEACRGLAVNAARVIHAHHNIFGIFWRCQRWISSGPLAPIIQRYSPPMLSEPLVSWIRIEDAHLVTLSRLWEDDAALLPDQKWALSDSLTSLRDTFAMVTQLTILPPSHVSNNPDLATIHRALSAGRLDDLPSVMTWYIRLSPSFVNMIEQENPYAMVVFAHFSILLDRYCSARWWMHQLPRRFVDMAQLILGEERKRWIEWPLAVVTRESDALLLR